MGKGAKASFQPFAFCFLISLFPYIPAAAWGIGDVRAERAWRECPFYTTGSRSFVENVRALLGLRVKGRNVIGGIKDINAWKDVPHMALFGAEYTLIGPGNIYFGAINND